MHKVLVTGGSGLLGRYIVDELAHRYAVTIADKAQSGARQPHGPVDVLNLAALAPYVEGQDAIVHLAAIDAAIDASPRAFFHTNVMAAWNVFHAGYAAGVRRFVLCSSSSVYGLRTDALGCPPKYLPVDEEHPLFASDPYGLSKRACETVAAGFAARADAAVVILRPCFIAFPFELPRMRSVYASGAAPKAAAGEWVPPMPDMHCYVAPEDVARGFYAALRADVDFEICNLSAADTFTSKPTVEQVRERFGRPNLAFDEAFYATTPRGSPLAIGRAATRLGWSPAIDWPTLERRDPR